MKEMITELVNERINSFETILSANNVNVEQCEKKVASILEFMPVEDIKYQELNTSEEYITKIAKIACKGIFDETRDTVNDHTQE